jgi:EmrB/QacA subfamily drug resistance transporter
MSKTDLSQINKNESPTLTHKQILSILAGLMMGLFLAALDQTIVASAIRTIGDQLHGLSIQVWVTTAYLITATITTPLYGKISDIRGRKPLFLFAITVFILGSALSSFATSMYMLAGFRALQGIGAGGLFTLAFAIIGDIVPPRERAKYQGYFVAVFGTSSVLGPVVGGFFAGAHHILGIAGWRWVFLVNVPIGLAALVVVAKTLHIPHTKLEHRIDWLGAVALSVSLVPLLIIAEQGRQWGWGSGRAITCYAVGLLGLLGFYLSEKRIGEEALIPSLIVGVGMFGGLAALPLYLQIVKGLTPTRAGLMLFPLTFGIMLGSIVAGKMISSSGRYRRHPIAGMILMIIGIGSMTQLTVSTPFILVALMMTAFGFGLGNILQPLNLAVQNSVPPREIGVATASATFFRQMGGTLGTAIFLSILFSTVTTKIASAYKAFLTSPAFTGLMSDPKFLANPANKATLQAFKSGTHASGAINDTSFLQKIDPRLALPFKASFASSIDLICIVGAGVMVIGFLVILLLPELELRSKAGVDSHAPVIAE